MLRIEYFKWHLKYNHSNCLMDHYYVHSKFPNTFNFKSSTSRTSSNFTAVNAKLLCIYCTFYQQKFSFHCVNFFQEDVQKISFINVISASFCKGMFPLKRIFMRQVLNLDHFHQYDRQQKLFVII